jgi:hypothetical protein
MSNSADGFEVLTRMAERQREENERRSSYKGPGDSGEGSGFLPVLLLGILLFIIWATGATP